MASGPSTTSIPETNSYAYPFSNSTNGGQLNSEKNLRNALLNVLAYSGAFNSDDFAVTSAQYIYTDLSNKHLLLTLGTGRGNCNSYYTEITQNCENFEIPFDIATYDNGKYDGKPVGTVLRLGLYLCVDYAASNIITNISLKLVANGLKAVGASTFDESDTTLTSMLTGDSPYSKFHDIGIYIGYFLVTTISTGIGISFDTNFTRNPSITKCIDISRLGDENDLGTTLEKIITRLWKLNIFSGDFFISDTVIEESGQEKDIGSLGAIAKYGKDYRIKMHVENQEVSTGTYQISGNISFAGFDASGVEVTGTIIKICEFSTSPFSASTIPSITSITFNDLPITFAGELTLQNDVTLNGIVFSSTSTNTININSTGSSTIPQFTLSDDASNSTVITSQSVSSNAVYGAVWN